MNLPINPSLQKVWTQEGFNQATAIQEQVYDLIAAKQSVLAISPTGTGKTLAYLLPLLNKVEANHTLQLIIFGPTQELVKQISLVVEKWAQPLGLTWQLIIGSANVKRQIDALKNKPEIIIATPGRFYELMQESKKLKVHQVTAVVYDEADYLLTDQQAEAIKHIQKRLMKDVQHIWVSATHSPQLKEEIASWHQEVQLVINEALPQTISHYTIIANNRQKVATLKRIAQIDNMQALVFFDQVADIEVAAAKLIHEGVKVASLHSQLNKQTREMAIKLMKEGKVTFLLTTDLASRGLDIEHLPYVIHYNKANSIQSYLHRSGRTGRMNRQGSVLSLVNEQEERDLHDLLEEKDLQVASRYVYNGQLMTLEEREAARLENVSNEKQVSKKIKSPKKQSVSRPTPAATKKKKNRHRDQKNKGKRKVKGDKG